MATPKRTSAVRTTAALGIISKPTLAPTTFEGAADHRLWADAAESLERAGALAAVLSEHLEAGGGWTDEASVAIHALPGLARQALADVERAAGAGAGRELATEAANLLAKCWKPAKAEGR